MKVVSTIKEVRESVKEWKKQGLTVGLVPTMGYLHEGHGSLIKTARENNDKVSCKRCRWNINKTGGDKNK